MRDSSLEITRLCEAWRDRIADASRIDQGRYAEELLRLLGWDQPLPFSPKEGAEALSAAPYLLRAAGQTSVGAYFVMPGTLEPPSALAGRGLDYCVATRVLTDEARSLNVNYVLITDLYRSYLYEVPSDELLLFADDPKTFNAIFTPVLKKSEMERGALEEVRRPPRSEVARKLRDWSQRWIETIAAYGQISEDCASLAVDRLLVIRHLFDRDILRRTKGRLQQRFMDLTDRAWEHRSEGTGRQLVKLFHDMWLDWRIDLFEATLEIDQVLEMDNIAVPLLKECSLLSNAKFNFATILESFNDGDPAEKMRVRLVPDTNEEREAYLNRQNLDTVDEARLEIDLLEDGYRAIFHWFDKVVALYERLAIDFELKSDRENPEPEEMDLFAWSERNAHRPEACTGHMAYACERGFGIYYNSPRQYRIARLMLTLHLISRYHETRQAIDTFPSLRNVLVQRPKVLSADRIMQARISLDNCSNDSLGVD